MRMLSLRGLFPLVSKVGAGVLLLGIGVDLFHHLGGSEHIGHPPATAFTGHVLSLIGMALVLAGVIQVAVQTLRRADTKGGNDAACSSTAATR